MCEEVKSERHGLGHALLAALPLTEVITTNYDDLFELARVAAGACAMSFRVWAAVFEYVWNGCRSTGGSDSSYGQGGQRAQTRLVRSCRFIAGSSLLPCVGRLLKMHGDVHHVETIVLSREVRSIA